MRDQLLARNIDRHIPVRTKDQVLHHVRKHRRLMLPHHLANDDAHREVQLVLRVIAAQHKLRQIHHQPRMQIWLGQPAPALQRVLQLRHAIRQRNIQRLDRLRRQLAVLCNAVPMLIVLHATDRKLELKIGAGRLKRNVAQQHHPPVATASTTASTAGYASPTDTVFVTIGSGSASACSCCFARSR